MPPTINSTPFDGELIRMRALNLGISLRQLSERCGISFTSLQRLIEGENQSPFMLGTMVRLAQELDTTIQGLLRNPAPGPVTPDALQLEAALLAARRRLTLSELQTALGFDRPRLLAALDALSDALIGTGAQLSRSGNKYTIGPRDGALSKATLSAVKTVRDGRSELSFGEAQMLRRIMRGGYSDPGASFVGGPARARIGALIEHGLVQQAPNGLALSPEIEFSLGLRARPPRRRDPPRVRRSV